MIHFKCISYICVPHSCATSVKKRHLSPASSSTARQDYQITPFSQRPRFEIILFRAQHLTDRWTARIRTSAVVRSSMAPTLANILKEGGRVLSIQSHTVQVRGTLAYLTPPPLFMYSLQLDTCMPPHYEIVRLWGTHI